MEEKKKVSKKKKILIGIIITTIVLVAVIVAIVLVQSNAKQGLSIDDLLNEGLENFIGSKVIGYDDYDYVGADVGWLIYYIDENNIYLIADDYIAYEYIPYNSSNHRPIQSSFYPRAVYLNSKLLRDYEGSASITDEKLKALNNSYYSQSYSSTNNNMKAVAYMMDTDAWSVYEGSSAEYAIGGPTIELLLKSYNAKYGTDYQAKATSECGYEISTDGGSSWGDSETGVLDTSDRTYVISEVTNAYGMRVASPSANSSDDLVSVGYGGRVSSSTYSNFLLRITPDSLSKI